MVEATAEKKITVSEEGNRRKNITSDDVKQTLNDLTEWFKTNAPAVHKKL